MAEIKQTPVVEEREFVDRASGIWERNSKQILIGIGVVLAAIIGFVAYRELVSGPEKEKAADAMFRAQEYYGQDSVKLALNGDNLNPGFLKIISKYDGTPAANL